MANKKHAKYDVTLEALKNHITYDAEKGTFYRKKDGVLLGSLRNDDGYIDISLNVTRGNTTRYRAHILVWLFETGRWPDLQIDHINGIRHDNRFINLREATQSQNNQNVTTKGRGATGLRGVYIVKNKKRGFRAAIQINGRTIGLGSYFTAEDAHAAYIHAKLKYHEYNDRTVSIYDISDIHRALPRYTLDGVMEVLCRVCGDSDPNKFNIKQTRSTCLVCKYKRESEQRKERNRRRKELIV